MFWNGPLWRASRDASHVGRFAASYLAVAPAVLMALAASRRLSGSHFLASVGSIWALKLVVTAVLYLPLAPGPAAVYAPRLVERDPGGAAPAPDTASPQTVSPVTAASHTAVPDAVDLLLAGGRYTPAAAHLRVGGIATVHSGDAVVHTVHAYLAGRAIANVPLLAHARIELPLDDPGDVELLCDHHAGERAVLSVVPGPQEVTIR